MELKNFQEDITEIKQNIELLKNILLSEGELTEWAKKELENSRGEKEDSYVSLDSL